MISWIIILILVVAALIALKMNKIRHKIWIIVVIFLALFLYTSMTLVYSKHNLELNSVKGISEAAKIYLGWLGNGFQNLKFLTGNAINMNWTSSNGTFFNKTEIDAKKI